MPQVTIATGFTAGDGKEEILSEYQCDVAHCPNTATQVLGFSRELGRGFAVCSEHAPAPRLEAGPTRACDAKA